MPQKLNLKSLQRRSALEKKLFDLASDWQGNLHAFTTAVRAVADSIEPEEAEQTEFGFSKQKTTLRESHP